MKYNVGDIVKIKENLIENNDYGVLTLWDSMMPYVGDVVTIIECVDEADEMYDVKENIYSWTMEMLEPVDYDLQKTLNLLNVLSGDTKYKITNKDILKEDIDIPDWFDLNKIEALFNEIDVKIKDDNGKYRSMYNILCELSKIREWL